MKKLTTALLPMLLLLLIVQATAGVVTSLPSGTVVPIPAIDYQGPGPQVFGGGIAWSSTNAIYQGGSVFGYTGGYGFGSNGYWDGTLGPLAGLNDAFYVYGVSDTMTFAFPAPVSGVGGFLNYVPDGSTPTTIAVWDSAYTLIESFDLTFLTGGDYNTGAFYGFLEASPIIRYFTLTDNYVGITDLTVQGSVSAVPEPASLLLLGSGALVLIGALRRKRPV